MTRGSSSSSVWRLGRGLLGLFGRDGARQHATTSSTAPVVRPEAPPLWRLDERLARGTQWGTHGVDQPVSLRPSAIALLVLSGVALGSQVDRLGRALDSGQLPGAEALTGAGLHVREWVAATAEHSRALFTAHSQAAGAPMPLSAPPAASVPLSGCLSPYFISDAAAKAAPAVCNIMVQVNGLIPTGSSGSGFLVDPDGTILTNAHVVADAIHRYGFNGLSSGRGPSPLQADPGSSSSSSSSSSGGRGITVTLQDGRIFEGQLISYDTVSDLAVLKVDSDAALPSAKLGRSSLLRVGEWVVALGSPLHLQNSVTAGIVSCVDRKAVDLGLAGARTDYIQTDAAINKGNSGGPLVNLAGEVVGISSMKALAADGVSFAIPVDTAIDVMHQLKLHGRVIRPYVGIKMLQLTPHNAAQFRRRDPRFPDVQEGILVPHVYPGSPAERAGLRPGDVIVGLGGASRRDLTTAALIKALGSHVGLSLELQVVRPGGGTTPTTLSVSAVEAP